MAGGFAWSRIRFRRAARAAGAASAAVVLTLLVGGPACKPPQVDSLPPSAAASAPAPAAQGPWFDDATDAVGLTFSRRCGFDGTFHLAEIMGGGCGLFDCDGDNDLDILLLDGGVPPRGAPLSPTITSRLWRNDGGHFVDVTEQSGLANRRHAMGCAAGDFDNDGDLDLFLTNYGPTAIYRNEGGGRFSDWTPCSGIELDGWSVAAVFFDYDRDGWLDLYVVRYISNADDGRCTDHAGRPDYCNPAALAAAGDRLYRNRGGAVFQDVTRQAGMDGVRLHGLGVVAGDFNADGWPDLYVANDGDPNNVWINNRDGTFREEGLVRGGAVNAAGRPEASMGVALADATADGTEDVLLTHLAGETNTLYRVDGQGFFEDVTPRSGLGPPSLPLTGFGVALADFDHDGWLDAAIVNGRVTRGPRRVDCDLPPPLDEFAEPGLLFRGRPTLPFDNAAALAGPLGTRPALGRGLACGDLDGDGDEDLLVCNGEGRARLYRNVAPKAGRWLSLRAIDPRVSRDAIGARVHVTAGGRTCVRRVGAGGSYASAQDPRVHFGLGDAPPAVTVTVQWPDGTREAFADVAVDQRITLTRGGGSRP